MKLTKVRNGILPAFLALLVAAVGAGTVFAKSSPPPGQMKASTSKSSTAKASPKASPHAQPHMDAALSDLHHALSELNDSNPDKGGHRNKAIADVQDAIQQTKAGEQAAQ